ncbi:hypothetical protein NOR_02807 [Metarhizium rileyi]|uniref:GPI anchored protein n=1 Tax=Metarhizium rileyi (strain RCEF 4871) TaxID=1649241 RepID=A0A167G259_METRR|nr:hypothetical protein NOR_02807 [Metarhizium rileyi RCEF 4871]
MALTPALSLLPASLLIFVSQALAASGPFPTAIKKQSADSSEKILKEHLAFAPIIQVKPAVTGSSFFDALAHEQDPKANGTSRFHPPFVKHFDETGHGPLRRAAEALFFLERRSSCPSGMNSCAQQGSPNKCCQEGTYCTDVPDTDVGHVACCRHGSTCGGGVGKCPSGATSCAAALGGGCCIPGFVCQGFGCVPSASTTSTTVLETSQQQATVTSTMTTIVEGNPRVVTVTITQTASPGVTTETTTEVITPSTSTSFISNTNTDLVTGNPPWRPTGPSEFTSAPKSTPITQSGCPTGFYGCLATHGGGCCRTERDCQTHSCPPPSSTTIVSNGATIVVPATDLPKSTVSSTCAGGWFMCGQDAGPVAGCCPSGYSCGTASCFTAGTTETGKVKKEAPDQSFGAKIVISTFGTSVLITAASLLTSFV